MKESQAGVKSLSLGFFYVYYKVELQCFCKCFKYRSLVSDEYNVVVADRGFEEVVPADLCWIIVDLHCDLGSAEALFVWIACEVCLAAEMSAQVS